MPDLAIPSRPHLSPSAFEALGKLLWHHEEHGWQRAASAFLSISTRNVRFFAAEPPAASKPVPHGVEDALVAEVQRRLQDPSQRAAMMAWRDRLAGQLAAVDAALAQTDAAG